MTMSVRSEIEKISSIIVCEPGKDHDLMHPEHIQEYLSDGTPNPDYLLFDDLIDTQLAIKEHREFTNLIKLFTGPGGCYDVLNYFTDGSVGIGNIFLKIYGTNNNEFVEQIKEDIKRVNSFIIIIIIMKIYLIQF